MSICITVIIMNATFHVFDTERGVLSTAPGIVTSYPGGDTAVRELEPLGAGLRPVIWSHCGAIDYAAAGQWAAFHRNRSADAPVLVEQDCSNRPTPEGFSSECRPVNQRDSRGGLSLRLGRRDD